MKIALIGYGKMGKAIEEAAVQRGHTVALIVNSKNIEILTAKDFEGVEVAIEFSRPDSVIKNINLCAQFNVPMVVGTTGWHTMLNSVKETILQNKVALVYASNFSIGVNLFFELNKKLAQLMANHTEYKIGIKEIHHTQKLDSPSGTAISLAEDIMQVQTQKNNWVNHTTAKDEELEIISERKEEVPGTHVVSYTSEADSLSITHIASNRTGFALGAVIAAEWVIGKKGIFTMQNVLATAN